MVAGLSADYEKECRMLKNNRAGPNKAEIGRVVGEQYNIRLRQPQDSKALPASEGVPSRRIAARETTRGSVINPKVAALIAERKVTARENAAARKRRKLSADASAAKKGGGKDKCYGCRSEEYFEHDHCGLCKGLEQWTRKCEERRAEKAA